ncbi:MAG: DUF3240 family protein [Thermomonas haemolytica]
MSTPIRMTLVFPPELADGITEALSAHAGLPGYTLFHAEGHTSDFRRASAGEQVRGRVQRRVLWMLIDPAQLDVALDAVRATVASQDVRWWTEPVLAAGRLA